MDNPISCKTLMKDPLYIEHTELTLTSCTLLVLLVAFYATKLATLQVAILLFTAKVQLSSEFSLTVWKGFRKSRSKPQCQISM